MDLRGLFLNDRVAAALVTALVGGGVVAAGWFWTHPQSAAAMVNLRADGGGPINIVEEESGALLGTMDSPQSHYQAHPGAVYVHRGETWHVDDLDASLADPVPRLTARVSRVAATWSPGR